jgi:hypothetical protein
MRSEANTRMYSGLILCQDVLCLAHPLQRLRCVGLSALSANGWKECLFAQLHFYVLVHLHMANSRPIRNYLTERPA